MGEVMGVLSAPYEDSNRGLRSHWTGQNLCRSDFFYFEVSLQCNTQIAAKGPEVPPVIGWPAITITHLSELIEKFKI